MQIDPSPAAPPPYALVVAIYAAVVSTAALLWHIIRDLTDRGNLRVHCYLGMVIDEVGPEDNRTHLIYQITNKGRRPIMVTHFGGCRRADPGDLRTEFILLTNKLPKMLQPGEYVLGNTPDLREFGTRVTRLHAIDSHNKRYSAPRRDLRLIRDGLKKLQ